jgi:hypothetical protein
MIIRKDEESTCSMNLIRIRFLKEFYDKAVEIGNHPQYNGKSSED